MSTPIEDYALVGDCESAALISKRGSIDWLCWPRFDSDACFAALLGDASHGRWLLTAADENANVTRRYLDDTLILETRYETREGAVRVLDFMPPRGQASDLVRLVIGERGEMRMRNELVLRFGYGASVPWVMHIDEGVWRAVSGPDMVVLHATEQIRGEGMKSVADFTVRAGQRAEFVLTYKASHLELPEPIEVDQALEDAEDFWRDWVKRGRKIDRWSDAVTRSLITLRAMIYHPTGGVIAAPTTSLPEHLGGQRNWDYRYCWLRDATQTLLALMNAGYFDEATAWRDWLVRAVAGSPWQMQIMYGLAGERRLTELELPWLPGYENSKPVRIGNGAYAQLQLDVFGEVMDVLHQGRQAGLEPSEHAWAMQGELLKHLARIWDHPDHGLWEMRGPPQHFTYSKIMVWVAFDRAIKDAEHFGLRGPIDRWRDLRDRIHREVCERGYDPELDSFVQAYGSKRLDASLLLIGPLGFLKPEDGRFCGTVRAIERTLKRDGVVLRYDTAASDDGLPPGEGAFLACSFWLVDAYVMCGRMKEAEALFESLLAIRNDLGLLAEEYDVSSKRMLGNFPQAFSHFALINSAYNLCAAQKPAEQRAERELAQSS